MQAQQGLCFASCRVNAQTLTSVPGLNFCLSQEAFLRPPDSPACLFPSLQGLQILPIHGFWVILIKLPISVSHLPDSKPWPKLLVLPMAVPGPPLLAGWLIFCVSFILAPTLQLNKFYAKITPGKQGQWFFFFLNYPWNTQINSHYQKKRGE